MFTLYHCLLVVLYRLSLLPPISTQSPPYTPTDYILLNCGTLSNTTFGGREWHTDSLHILNTRTTTSSTRSDINPSIDPTPYSNARIFHSKFTYTFNLSSPGQKFLRLYFYPANYSTNLHKTESFFSVNAANHTLLSNFSAFLNLPKNQPTLVKEYILTVNESKLLELTFTPAPNSYAFINGIELVSIPEKLYIKGQDDDGDDDNHPRLISGRTRFYSIDNSVKLETLYRLNIGGTTNISPTQDSGMFRSWLKDEEYFVDHDFMHTSQQNFYIQYTSKTPAYTAPDIVYTSFRTTYGSTGQPYNFTWNFEVDSGFLYLLRLYFCELNYETGEFVILINKNTAEERADVLRWSGGYGNPVYRDYVVSVNQPDLTLVMLPYYQAQWRYFYVFFNGLEIFKLGPSGASLAALTPGVAVAPSPEPKFSLGTHKNSSHSNKLIGETKLDKKNKTHLIVIIGCVLGGVALVLLLLVIFWIYCRKAKAKPVENIDRPLVNLCETHSYTGLTERTGSVLSNLNLGLKVAFSDIMYATNNFDPQLMIGGGGFGKVYKGTFRNGLKVAVKRSESGHGQGFPEFQAEIMVLTNIRHRHLVALIGYCDEMSEMILVYEFMENGTLREHLYEKSATKSSVMSSLSWNQRLDICIGAAKGLHYLHTGSGGEIIHRDIKSTNILLDKDFVAKVSDFGLSRSGLPDQTHISTDVKGTYGYLDPEYCRRMQLTQKSDVYSFGVVLLEVLCARPVLNKLLPEDQVYLVDLGVSWQQKGQLEKIIDPFLVGKTNPNSLRKFGEIAVNCLNECGADRPSMVEVVWDLEYALQLQNQVVREPHEDSNADVSWAMELPVVQGLPSTGTFNEENRMSLGFDSIPDRSYANEEVEMPQGFNYIWDNGFKNATDVFSQLRVTDAR